VKETGQLHEPYPWNYSVGDEPYPWFLLQDLFALRNNRMVFFPIKVWEMSLIQFPLFLSIFLSVPYTFNFSFYQTDLKKKPWNYIYATYISKHYIIGSNSSVCVFAHGILCACVCILGSFSNLVSSRYYNFGAILED